MKKNLIVLIISTYITVCYSQKTIKGRVVDSHSLKPLQHVIVKIQQTKITTRTLATGDFVITTNTTAPFNLEIIYEGYRSQLIPISNTLSDIDLGMILLVVDIEEENTLTVISLSDDELTSDTSFSDTLTGLLQASKDVVHRAAAFDFSNSFFRLRGLDSDFTSVLIDGIVMNKMHTGKPQWSNWGGLNDITKNQVFYKSTSSSPTTFGNFLGTTVMSTRASEFPSLAKATYTFSNRSYQHRVMLSYASGILKNNWSYVLSGSKRWATEGYADGTLYNANAFFVGIEKQLDSNHSVAISGIISPNTRGKSSPNTDEVTQLKSSKYNAYWGYQNGKKRNSRIKNVHEPLVILNHNWSLSEHTQVSNHFSYQNGTISNTRIDYGGTDINPQTGFPEGGGVNPDPTYYQRLPSYALRNFPDQTQIAYGLQQHFQKDGQIRWDDMYRANRLAKIQGFNAIYVMYEDRTDDSQFTFSSQLITTIHTSLELSASLVYRSLLSDNYAKALDLLDGKGYLDIQSFSTDFNTHPNSHQNNISDPNRLVSEGERFKYAYTFKGKDLGGFIQLEKTAARLQYFIGLQGNRRSYLRTGLYTNGRNPENSFGKGKKLDFWEFGLKLGGSYSISGIHIIELFGSFQTKAPHLIHSYINPREHHSTVPNLTQAHQLQLEGSYFMRTPKLISRLTGYYIMRSNETNVSYYYTDGLLGDQADFVQETLTNIDKKHVGFEFGLEWKPLSVITLKSVATVGEFIFANNPELFLSSDKIGGPVSYGKSYLKNYKLPTGPQQAFSIGFEYRDPSYWWFSISANHLKNSFTSINALQRTTNFYTDYDGLPFNDYDEDIARSLLYQQKLQSHTITNLVCGKSWKLSNYYLNVFVSISNLLNTSYKTGGFEQARNANYRNLLEDHQLDIPVFGPKYWYGNGTTFFINLSLTLRNP